MTEAECKKAIDETFERLKELVPNHEGWSEVSHPDTVDWSYTRILPNTSVNIVKASGKVPRAAKDVHMRLWLESEETKKKDDVNLIEHQQLETFGKNDGEEGDMNVIYQLYSLPWPMSNRDMIICRGVRIGEDGTIYNVNCSVESPKDPKPKKVVRSTITNTAYIFKPVSDTECIVTYIVCMDPKGSIPKWLVNQNIGNCALRVDQIHRYEAENN